MQGANMTRRQALKLSLGAPALAAGLLGNPLRLLAAQELKLMNLGFALGIHCPSTRGIVEELPGLGVELQMQRFQRIRDNVQAVLGGAGDVGISGPIVLLRSVQAGNDIRIFGNNYVHTSLVVIVNREVIKTWKDFERDDVTVGINSQGDITQVMIIGGLLQNNVATGKVTWADIGGSGSRMRALIAGRTQASVVHFDQVPRVKKEGNFEVILVPARQYDPWVNEVFYTRADWLKRRENRALAVKLMKAVITGHRKANASFDYYKQAFLEYATIGGKDKMSDAQMREYYETIAHDMGVWPADNQFHVSNFRNLMPYYKAANAVKPDVPIDMDRIVDTSIVAQALKELA